MSSSEDDDSDVEWQPNHADTKRQGKERVAVGVSEKSVASKAGKARTSAKAGRAAAANSLNSTATGGSQQTTRFGAPLARRAALAVDPAAAEEARQLIAASGVLCPERPSLAGVAPAPLPRLIKKFAVDGAVALHKKSRGAGAKATKYLIALPGQFMPLGTGEIGTLEKLDTPNPELLLHWPEQGGQLRLRGTIAYPKARYITLAPGKQQLQCEEELDSLIVFSKATFIRLDSTQNGAPSATDSALPSCITRKLHDGEMLSASCERVSAASAPGGRGDPKPARRRVRQRVEEEQSSEVGSDEVKEVEPRGAAAVSAAEVQPVGGSLLAPALLPKRAVGKPTADKCGRKLSTPGRAPTSETEQASAAKRSRPEKKACGAVQRDDSDVSVSSDHGDAATNTPLSAPRSRRATASVQRSYVESSDAEDSMS
eukprot:CAMPEP_0119354566 /NCGR_PEP_ID=MMETSP1334-20130426/3546_1 /TAXON_ID=127549 /ORGANISM="Calcidiscus leptoporus, Strain RCC1130" /LENGTH=427 /DNA_ID=CAMNT_0007368153 /DNA_START=30 /DNA_END=1313 /DNA_ORIENTATION=-